MARVLLGAILPVLTRTSDAANKRELVNDFVVKAKQIDYLIQSLPEPEAEEVQVRPRLTVYFVLPNILAPSQANRLQDLENQMAEANADYARAVARASTYLGPYGYLLV